MTGRKFFHYGWAGGSSPRNAMKDRNEAAQANGVGIGPLTDGGSAVNPLTELVEGVRSRGESGAFGFRASLRAEDADVVVLPWMWRDYVERGEVALARTLVEIAARLGKPCVIFHRSDNAANVPFPGVVVIETSGYASRRAAGRNEVWGLPPFLRDYVKDYCDGHLTIREKGHEPTVGFCGQAGGYPWDYSRRRLVNWFRHAMFRLGFHAWEPAPFETTAFRKRVLKRLLGESGVRCEFLIRARYRAGYTPPVKDPWHSTRLDFVRNIRDSDYTLCMRGGGNYSVRFYETLCLGRIPIFVDTDCVLPFDDELDYRNLCVWVDAGELEELGARLRQFHARLSPAEFRDLQVRCRNTWVEHLERESYLRWLARRLGTLIVRKTNFDT